MTTKSRIRKEIKEKLNKQNLTQRLHKSRLIKEKLFKLAEFKRAKYVMFYVATDKEVETSFMITEAQKIGKKIVVPTILAREKSLPTLQKGGQAGMVASLIEDLVGQPVSEESGVLSLGPYGIRQPKRQYIREVPGKKIDLVVVPGLAFDRQGHRLGRGGGYYDKFLARLTKHTPRIGLAFDFQVLGDLPVFSHDISVNKVISA